MRRSVRSLCWTGIAGFIAGAALSAQQAPQNRAERLGFRYDPAVREAALARRETNSLELEPADPDVVRLPKYEVKERPIILREDELLTPEGRVALAKQRYLTPMYQKVFGPLAAVASLLNNPLGGWNPNGPEALAIYYDNLNLQRRKEMNDLISIAELGSKVKQENAAAARARARQDATASK